MSFLTIDKKAVTKEDAQGLLDQTYALTNFCGVPIQFFDPVKLKELGDDEERGGAVMAIAREFVDTALGKDHPDRDKTVTGAFSSMMAEFREWHVGNYVGNLTIFAEGYKGHQGLAWLHEPSEYTEPRSSIIQTFSETATREDIVNVLVKGWMPIEGIIPGYDEQWRFLGTWHEMGHVVGSDEPQAEAIAAVAYRRAFEDHNVLRATGDVRALEILIDTMENSVATGNYYWPMIELNDYLARMPEATIMRMSEEQIRDIRFQDFDNLHGRMNEIAWELKTAIPEDALWIRNFDTMHKVALDLSEQSGFGDIERQMLLRFTLACRRLSVGEDAYYHENDFVSDELLASERVIPITFTPGEFIPE